MAVSFFDYPELKGYELNLYKHRRLGSDFNLVTTQHGGWAVLSDNDLSILRKKEIAVFPNLFKTLEETGIILTENNIGKVRGSYKRKFSYLTTGVTLHIIAPTIRCNHRCIYCHANSIPFTKKGYTMDEDTAKKVVDFIFQCPSKEITIEFQGGEPLLAFPIIEFIINYSQQMSKKTKKKVNFIVVSNLSLLDGDMSAFFAKNMVGLCTSLDGPKEVHDKNRRLLGEKSSYDAVVHAIRDLRAQGISVNALPTITKFSLPYAKDIVDEYASLAFDRIRIRSLNNAGYANKNWRKIAYSPQEFIKFWTEALEYTLKINKEGRYLIEGTTVLLLRKLLSIDYQGYTCLGMPCGAAINQASYLYNGDVFMCDESRSFDVFKIGTVKDKSYTEVFTSPQVANIISLTSRAASLCDNCVWQPFCGTCVVCTYGHQKNVVSKLPMDYDCACRSNMFEHLIKKLMLSENDRAVLLRWASTKKGV